MSLQGNKQPWLVEDRESRSSKKLMEEMSQIFGRLWLVFRVFGLLPFQIKRSSGYWFYKISVEGSLYCAINLLGMATLVVVSQRESPRSPISVATNSSSWLDNFIVLYGNVLGPACLLLHWLRRRSLFLLAKTLLEVDQKLQGLTTTPLMTRKIYAFLISIVVPSLNLMALIILATSISAIVSLPLSFWLSSFWSKCFIFALQYQFTMVQVAVRKRFAALNFLLEEIPPCFTLSELTQCIRKRVKKRFVSCKVEAQRQLAEAHRDLGFVLYLFNDFYGILLVLNLFAGFLDSVYLMFLMVRFMIDAQDRFPPGVFPLMFLMSCLTVVNLLVVFIFCHYTTQEVDKTAKCIHKVYNASQDKDIKKELIMFSKEVVNRRYNLRACGIFPMDFSVLYAIINAVTTYLVILLQFQFQK